MCKVPGIPAWKSVNNDPSAEFPSVPSGRLARFASRPFWFKIRMSPTARLCRLNSSSTVLIAGASSGVPGNAMAKIRPIPMSMASISNNELAVPISADSTMRSSSAPAAAIA